MMTTGSGVTWWRVRRDALLACLGSRDSAYVYDLDTVRAQVAAFGSLRSVSQALYALKANPHPEILRTVHAAGCGFECVSRAEVERVLAEVTDAGRERLLFTPNFAPRAEYAWALERGLRVTVDNLSVLRDWPGPP
jgi:diaminopimelate decarboxylase/aspartate kinase